jgi:hypothetical protein
MSDKLSDVLRLAQVRCVRLTFPGCGFVSTNKGIQHSRSGHTRKVRIPRGGGERKPQPYEIVSGIANDSLIEIPDLNGNVAVAIRQCPEIAQVTITTDPHGGSVRD